MYRNYIKITFRNMLHDKSVSIINILGLAIGMTCVILIILWIQRELSYDNYHKKAKDICEVYLKSIHGEDIGLQAGIAPSIAGKLKNEFPEINNVVRIGFPGVTVFKYDNKLISESNGIAADTSIFNIFTYPFISGDPKYALNEPYSIVLTETMAKKYFGKNNAIGQIITLNTKYSFKVTGVIKDLPQNSYVKFDFIVPFTYLKEIGFDIVGSDYYPCMYFTYALLQPDVSYKGLSSKISKRFFADGKDVKFEICLVPFKSVYLQETGGKTKIVIFSLLGLIIIVIASVNFINLSTAKFLNRLKEVGIRKVLGANRKQLVVQFLIESTIYSILAIDIAILFTKLILPGFNTFIHTTIVINYTNAFFILSLFIIVVITGIFAGIYPSLFISSFSPIQVLKGNNSPGHSLARLRKVLIVFQFTLSIILIVCSITLNKQKRFVTNFNLGLNKENILYARLDGEIVNNFETLKNELLRIPNIQYVTSASALPIDINSDLYTQWGVQDNHDRRICETYVDYDYLKTFKIKLVEGRFYSKYFLTDQDQSIVVNEAAIKKLGLKSPIGKQFYYWDHYYTLIGIVESFQHNSLYESQPIPVALRLRPNTNDFLFIKINDHIKDIYGASQIFNMVKTICDKFSPNYPLDYKYLNDYSFEIENKVQVFQKLTLYGTLLAIFIACLGLYGLSYIELVKRTKEIGIRKVIGATSFQILLKLSMEFIKLVGIAFIIACPVAYFIMDKILQYYAYRTSLSWWIFVLAGFLTVMISLITVFWQSLKVATRNPVDALRYE